MKDPVKELLGPQCLSDNKLTHSMRQHQSWWRAFVLNQPEGLHLVKGGEEKAIGSSIKSGTTNLANFLHRDAIKAVKETLKERVDDLAKGLISEDRLFNNLLSSQPLCFNFFGPLKYNLALATQWAQQFYPDVQKVTHIYFEFAPNASANNDNSAHDVALEFVSSDNKKGLIGLECKYTEPFSPKAYDKPEYLKIYQKSNAFTALYPELIKSAYNQLFRNQLIVESAKLNGVYDVVHAGVFCYQEDRNALAKGKAFQKMLKNGETRFKVITFQDFIESMQTLILDWETRQWTMLLWARYCALQLSENWKIH